ncbi:hypothetical protein AGMMS49975_04480 [Clostridia bacterium]|nr:hypothetical protein AGMMS49975_04480 [Clostridia bacterium]
MDFFMKLPRNPREFALFMAIVSVLSVNVLAPLITCFEVGFSLGAWTSVLRVIPFVWLSVITLVLLTHKPAEWLTSKIVDKDDSFNAHITVNIMCSVLLMSAVLTIVGAWIGERRISAEPIQFFFYRWPRNFALAFAVEALFAQPIARAVLLRLHQYKDDAISYI